MTLNAIIKRIKARSHRGDQSITNDSITSDIIMAIEDARKDITKLIPKDANRTTGSFVGTADSAGPFSLASDLIEPIAFWYTISGQDYSLTKVPSEREFRKYMFSSTAVAGKPAYYFEAGPDSSGYRRIQTEVPFDSNAPTVNYSYYKDPTKTPLIAGTAPTSVELITEITNIPNHLANALWVGGLAYFLQNFDDDAKTYWNQKFGQMLMGIEIDEESNPDEDQCFRWDVKGRSGGMLPGTFIERP